MTLPRITDDRRRDRLVRRHGLSPQTRHPDLRSATRALTAWHATEPASVHLALHARVDGITVADVEQALFEQRWLVKQLAMRRTLFAFDRDLVAAVVASAGARTLAGEVSRSAGVLERDGIATDGRAWLDEARERVAAVVSGAPDGLTLAQVRKALPDLDLRVEQSPGAAWSTGVPVIGWLLTQLGTLGRITRGPQEGHWRNPRHRWIDAPAWHGVPPPTMSSGAGYREVIRAYVSGFGPVTEADIVWWLGATKGSVRSALAELDVVPVQVAVGAGEFAEAFVLADDLDDLVDGERPRPAAALLPVLDPTVMGWRGRDFYLDPQDVAQVSDGRGNLGATVWWDGRVVGAWAQTPDGTVRTGLLHEVPRAGHAAIAEEAERLQAFVGTEHVSSVYPSPLMKALRTP